jgi:hypothetical protein
VPASTCPSAEAVSEGIGGTSSKNVEAVGASVAVALALAVEVEVEESSWHANKNATAATSTRARIARRIPRPKAHE